MPRGGASGSWRFAEGIDKAPLVALYVRDRLDLPVPTTALVPPRLEGVRPDDFRRLDIGRRTAAGAEWAGWWSAVVTHEVRSRCAIPDGVEQPVWIRQRIAEARMVFDPPEFTALTDRPALRAAVQASFPEMLQWTTGRRHALLQPPGGRPAQFDYQLVRTIAEETARQYRVRPDAVAACAVVLPVEGHWWYRCAPGAIVCSLHAARDAAVARAALTDAFASGLDA